MEIPANFTEKYNSYNEHLNKTCQSILKRWSKIGFNKEEISNRTTMIFTALKDSLNDIDEGENKLVGDIEKNLLDYKHKVELLEIQLNLDDEKRTRPFTTLLDDCRYYKQIYQRLLDVKKERKSRYSSLANKQSELCAILGEKPYETTSDKPEFDLDEIEQLEKHVNELSLEKSERLNELRQMCAEKLLILDKYQLSLPACSSLNQLRSNSVDDFEHISMGLDSMNRFRLSLEKLKTRSERLVEDIDLLRDEIRLNWRKYELTNPDMADLIEDCEYNQATLDRLISESRRCHRAKMNKIGEFTEKIRNEIEAIWNELGFVDEDKTEFIDYMNPDKQLTEDLFIRHETYLAELNEIYAKRIELTNKIRNWEKIWNEYRQFEIDYSDPNRFKQKRYSPLIENKLRTKFTSDLGKLEKEILFECDRFARNEGSEFKVDGVNFASRVAQKRAEFDKWRQDCRIERQMKMETAKKGGLTPHKKGNTPSRKPVVAITNTKSAQIVKGSVAVKPKLVTQSPLRASVTTKCSSPSVRRTVLGHLQPANVQSTSHTVAVSKSIKRRSIKSMHSILKRRSRGSTLGTADNETNGDMITPKKAPSIHHYPTPPHIRILNPKGHVIGGYSPSSSSRPSAAIDSNKRARFECLDSSLIASSEASDSALFLSNLNSSFHHLSSTPV